LAATLENPGLIPAPDWIYIIFSLFFIVIAEGKFLVTKLEFEGSFSMSVEGYCHEVKVIFNLELLVIFGMSLEGVCHELYAKFHYKLIPNLQVTKITRKQLPLN
jgi:hypothetical protein